MFTAGKPSVEMHPKIFCIFRLWKLTAIQFNWRKRFSSQSKRYMYQFGFIALILHFLSQFSTFIKLVCRFLQTVPTVVSLVVGRPCVYSRYNIGSCYGYFFLILKIVIITLPVRPSILFMILLATNSGKPR